MLLLVDKPKGMTSHDVVDVVRRVKKVKKVGHGGTLDPLATGLLIVGVGREQTKKLGDIAKNKNKTYDAEITLGETRETDDAEGAVIRKYDILTPPTERELENTLKSFVGKLDQVPPAYSAIKVRGKPAHRRARAGEQVTLGSRKIEILRINLIEYRYPKLKIETEVSSGTYIRALARDIGARLGTGAYLSELHRTQIGEYSIVDALQLDKLQ